MRLALTHPYLPSCDDCCKWLHGDNWQPTLRMGKFKIERPAGSPTPCHKCPKIPLGEETCPRVGRSSELTEQNWQTWRHYNECKAVGEFPNDLIVRRNAGLIRMVEDQVDRANAAKLGRIETLLAGLVLR